MYVRILRAEKLRTAYSVLYRQPRVGRLQTCPKYNTFRSVLIFDFVVYSCLSASKYYFRKQQRCVCTY